MKNVNSNRRRFGPVERNREGLPELDRPADISAQ